MMKDLFLVATGVIAVDYLLLGFYWLNAAGLLSRARSKVVRPKRLALFAYVAMATFFFGCVHTHVDLLLLPPNDPHWYTWWNVTSHWAQAIGGFVFWYLTRTKLVVNIFDRKSYDRAVNPDTNARLDRLAAEIGVYRP